MYSVRSFPKLLGKVDIYFTAVGLIDISTEQEIEKMMEQYKKRFADT